jgi:hypothetical protein
LVISGTFGVVIDKHVVRRVLAKHYRAPPRGMEPSWLAFPGHTEDSLWSTDLLRCESILLNSNWVLVTMDQFTHCIVGFGIHRGNVVGPPCAACSMCNDTGRETSPKRNLARVTVGTALGHATDTNRLGTAPLWWLL